MKSSVSKDFSIKRSNKAEIAERTERAEGIKEGMAKGSLSEKQDTIHRLRANGFDDKTIAIATGMSIDEIRDYLE